MLSIHARQWTISAAKFIGDFIIFNILDNVDCVEIFIFKHIEFLFINYLVLILNIDQIILCILVLYFSLWLVSAYQLCFLLCLELLLHVNSLRWDWVEVSRLEILSITHAAASSCPVFDNLLLKFLLFRFMNTLLLITLSTAT